MNTRTFRRVGNTVVMTFNRAGMFAGERGGGYTTSEQVGTVEGPLPGYTAPTWRANIELGWEPVQTYGSSPDQAVANAAYHWERLN